MQISNSYNKAMVSSQSSKTSDLNKLKNKTKNMTEDKQAMEAFKAFEGEFLKIMFKNMQKTLDDSNSIIPKSSGTKMMEDMYYESLAEESSKGSGMGLAKMLYEQYEKEKANRVNNEDE
ncbi:MAG: rod-binding protein [Peptostreptococcaceae bacterium]|jgi:flagellar protein FlgJ|nr:rod-binding protein [Peptostreptococcaceae bacterium]